MQNLVIVESPAKAKTIEKFLGKGYKVMSSYGHIRDLKRKEMSIDEGTMHPLYEIPEDKQKVVAELRSNAKNADTVWLASDEDREGEAISWHLCEVLNLDEKTTNRIVFHEITKPAILAAIENPRHLNMDLVNAQQARRILDRIVGFKLSPVLWRKVKPQLSAGRVQSVAVRLIVEREREVAAFKAEPYYRITAIFSLADGKELRAELSTRKKTREEALQFLELCKNATFSISSVSQKPLHRSPAPPFTTSTMQQEAARKLGFTVAQTMTLAQRLYEAGHITYMRTDSVNLSTLCKRQSKEAIESLYGKEYGKERSFHTHSKGAQEAHEAIRPTNMLLPAVEATMQEKRLYDLIYKRTMACQMSDAEIEKTTAQISVSTPQGVLKEAFQAVGEVIKFDGFLKVYHESSDDEDSGSEGSHTLPKVKEGDLLQRIEIASQEKFTTAPARYTEASLVHKMEELGIGRPSTYAPTISTIQQRDYVVKGDRPGQKRDLNVDTLRQGTIEHAIRQETVQSEKGKLLPTDVGIVVNDFLTEHFPEIMDYNFTAQVEGQFDSIAEGKEPWEKMLQKFYKSLLPKVKSTMESRSEHKAGERELGTDPKSKRQVFVKIGKFGPVVQIGKADEEEKPRFAQLPAKMSIETITLDEALGLFALPRTVGEFEGGKVVIGAGRFGPYVLHDKKYTSLKKGQDPYTITLEEAVELIQQKRETERNKHIKSFDNADGMEIKNGRYGAYVAYKGKNYRLPKAMQERAKDLTEAECMEVIAASKKK